MKNAFLSLRLILFIRRAYHWSGDRLHGAGNRLARVSTYSVNLISNSGEKLDEASTMNEGTLPLSHTPEPMSPGRYRRFDSEPGSPSMSPEIPSSPANGAYTASVVTSEGGETSTTVTTTAPSPARTRFASAVRSVMMLQSASNAVEMGPRRQRTTSSTLTGNPFDNTRKRTMMEPLKTIRSSRVANLVPKLKSLEATQDLAAHQALVRHLQFSPDGKFLATSRYVFHANNFCCAGAHGSGFG